MKEDFFSGAFTKTLIYLTNATCLVLDFPRPSPKNKIQTASRWKFSTVGDTFNLEAKLISEWVITLHLNESSVFRSPFQRAIRSAVNPCFRFERRRQFAINQTKRLKTKETSILLRDLLRPFFSSVYIFSLFTSNTQSFRFFTRYGSIRLRKRLYDTSSASAFSFFSFFFST